MTSRNGPVGREPARTAGEHPPGDVLVRIHDLAGRPRGLGFPADHRGTLITSHEAVDGLPRLVLHAPGDRHRVVSADAVTPLPELGLALVRSEGLGTAPLPVATRNRVESGTYVRIAAGCWREARVLGTTTVTYTAADRCHPLDDALELAIGTTGRDALRPGGGAAGGPVLDAATGAVLGVLGTALRSGSRDVGFAVPLRPARSPLAELLAENAATVPAYGTDLNVAGVLELTATSVGQDGPSGALAPGGVVPVERAATTAEFAAFERGRAAVLGLVGPPGSGRTTELAALAARRHRAGLPTLWLRGADLRDDDLSVANAAHRALDRAARIVAASRTPFPGGPEGLGDTGPGRLAALAGTAGRPLLVLLDGPEEMPSALADRLARWTDGTARWLRRTGARLVVGCRAEYWESAGALLPADLLHRGGDGGGHRGERQGGHQDGATAEDLPACVRLGDLTAQEAIHARARYGIPEGSPADSRHPLTLRLLSEVRAALADAPQAPDARADRHDVLSAHLDLMCLRVAVRLAAESGLRGTAVRRLAARVSGQVHEAARRSLGPGQGELGREAFEEVFPWGPAPARLGGGTGWASAVLAEGILVPAGTGYRFAHEELADWLHGTHLDLDAALRVLVHDHRHHDHDHDHATGPGTDRLPVPHHRIGPVVQAMLLLARHHGTGPLASRLADLVHALDADSGSWWAARLLTETLARVPDATPYTEVLRLLADRIVAWRQQRRRMPRELGPAFWTALPLPLETGFELLRRLVHADGPPGETGSRFLDAAARLFTADPVAVLPHLVRWFEDERPLPATPHATVATAAQALLHTHRHRAPDTLTEVLADSAHRRAGQLLTVLAEEDPSAMCRAVDRWARDERPARRAAAVAYGLRAAPHARDVTDRTLLRYAAIALLLRTADRPLHGGALALLVQDPSSRDRHLPRALEHFAAGDPHLPPSALTGALASHPEPVLEAFRARLAHTDARETLHTLADATTPALAPRVAALLRTAVEQRPDLAGELAAYAGRRLTQETADHDVLLPLLAGLLEGGPQPLRAALAGVLAEPGTSASRPLRRELLDPLLTRAPDPAVLAAVLGAAARCSGATARELVHRTGLLLVRTPDGAAHFDSGLVDLGRRVPGFAAALAHWLADAPQEWAAVVGPGTRRTIENLAGAGIPA
ncbi:trypsin-like peptidase domain-containing protein [Streptomyces sp. NWU339]|uniref:trypsin-like peptidase domain-containing protein n=1 Tax=Streptomyces sp. NWU339 TaxID=2185284 RepID=UPI00215AD14C|nr:trypsin-like peptidase domain-containing protein [Streptomyces sp. NWU339]